MILPLLCCTVRNVFGARKLCPFCTIVGIHLERSNQPTKHCLLRLVDCQGMLWQTSGMQKCLPGEQWLSLWFYFKPAYMKHLSVYWCTPKHFEMALHSFRALCRLTTLEKSNFCNMFADVPYEQQTHYESFTNQSNPKQENNWLIKQPLEKAL